MKKVISNKEKEEILAKYKEFKNLSLFQKIYGIKQHRTSNTFRHVCLVSEEALQYAFEHTNKGYDYNALIRGGMLHDFYFYDWRKDRSKMKSHLRSHPETAIKNAKEYFDLTETEIDIIRNHMWPITLTKFPKTKEGKLIMMMDKKVSIKEFFAKQKSTIFFDLDGTLIDTLPDLTSSVNEAMKAFNFPLHTKEEVCSFIGNGTRVLIERSIPKGTDSETYEKCYKVFYDHYTTHYLEESKPYEGMHDVLRILKEKGYHLGVITNKNDEIAKKMIDKVYPSLFEVVQGTCSSVLPKPDRSIFDKAIKDMPIHVRRSKILYVGDTNIDYDTARKSRIMPVLVSYGYRSREELIAIKNTSCIIDKPIELLDVLGINID